jgi:hypothetical protein
VWVAEFAAPRPVYEIACDTEVQRSTDKTEPERSKHTCSAVIPFGLGETSGRVDFAGPGCHDSSFDLKDEWGIGEQTRVS